jgi:hypothetical protein
VNYRVSREADMAVIDSTAFSLETDVLKAILQDFRGENIFTFMPRQPTDR